MTLLPDRRYYKCVCLTGKHRIILFTGPVLEIFKQLWHDARIFDSKHTRSKRRQMMVCFQKAVEAAGIGDFHFPDLRHTARHEA